MGGGSMHNATLHAKVALVGPHAVPPYRGADSTARVRSSVPPPHAAEHPPAAPVPAPLPLLALLQPLMTQATGGSSCNCRSVEPLLSIATPRLASTATSAGSRKRAAPLTPSVAPGSGTIVPPTFTPRDPASVVTVPVSRSMLRTAACGMSRRRRRRIQQKQRKEAKSGKRLHVSEG